MAKAKTQETKPKANRLPLGKLNERHYVQKHIDVRLTPGQANQLKRLVVGLQEQGAELKNGKRIVRAPDALRWMLENLETFRAD